MYILSHLLSLPPAIIALCATTSNAELQWPHNVPKHLKYFPEEEVHARRAVTIKEKLAYEKPIGIKKLSLDEGEMFMLDGWIFASDTIPPSPYHARDAGTEDYGNATRGAQSALRPLAQNDWMARMHIRDVLLKREYKCPDGTSSCESIGAPDVCCSTSSTCINVTNGGDGGDVGCCPKGQTCSGSVSCDTANGYSSCPDASNGGCCLPGFTCQGIGCVLQGTSTTYVQPSTSTSSTSTSAAASTSTAAIVSSTTSTPASTSSASSAYTCSTGWFSCPASLGGGCCMNGRTCATGASCLGDDTSSSTLAPDAPVRPTSGSATTTAASASNDVCPQGFYVCSAYYPSGCCRVGRDCQTTGTCVLPTKTVVSSNGIIIVAPTGASTAAAQSGSCPSAWYSCPADQGGNCCPNGYACGDQCTATASGQSGTETKASPTKSSGAAFISRISVFMMAVVSLGSGVAMVVL